MTVTELLRVENLAIDYHRRGRTHRAVSGVNLRLDAGRTLGLVGESGSGKTTVGRAILGLVPVAEGTVRFRGKDITAAGRSERRRLSRAIQVVFQDPYGSLNPAFSVQEILAEPLVAQGVDRQASGKRIRELLDAVGLPGGAGSRYPHEFSGGQRQRVAIARALALDPDLIVCDEPVSALDLTTQARVLDLFLDIQEHTGVAYLFISHDLDVVRHLSHEIAVMRQGEIVEHGSAEDVVRRPEHPYTQRLLLSSPIADPAGQAIRRQRLAELRVAELGTAELGKAEAVHDG